MGHTFGEAVVTKEATETQTGIKTSTCTICGESKEEVIPYAEPETPDEDEKTDATAGTEDESRDNGNNSLWIIIAAAAVALIGGVIITVISKKKKG